MKPLKALALTAVAAALAAPVAAQELSFNIGVVSLYKSNGVDQDDRQYTDEKNFRPALQGGVDYDFGNGFYVGNWNSTGRFGEANLEIDLYGGYAGQITDDLGFDVGYTHFYYPSDKSFGNSGEVHVALSYGPVTAKLAHGVTTDVNKGGQRFSLMLSQPLTEKLTLDAVVGFRNAKAGDFNDYGLGVSYDLGGGLAASAMWSGATKKDDPDATPGRDNRLVLGLSQSF